MKKWYRDNTILDNVITYSITGIIVVTFFYVINHLTVVKEFIDKSINICMPFIWGISFAFLLSGMVKKIEKNLPDKMSLKVKRFISVFTSTLFMIVVVSLFLLVLTPQIVESAMQLASNMSSYIVGLTDWLTKMAIKYEVSQDVINGLLGYSNKMMNTAITFVQGNLLKIMNVTYTTIASIGNVLIGIFIMIYILLDKERLYFQFNKLGKAFLKENQHTYLKHVYHLSTEKFNKFVVGKIIDSIIIGIICFIGMNAIGLDYPVLISFIVGLTNIIPFFGPFIGAMPSMFILLMIEPIQALWFSIWILILQQVDGNLIGPSILGDSMGLSNMWIMFAIIIGGGFFGVIGMFLGVPAFSVIYILLKENAEKRIAEKENEIKNEYSL